MKHRWFRDVKRALEMHGFKVLGCEDRGKHSRIRISKDGITCFVMTSATPSDVRTLKNLVTTAKHMIVQQSGL